jgi:hypothetical protein
MAPLSIIVARARVGEREDLLRSFADLPDCQVIVDRRVGERRRREPASQFVDRRHGDRRSGQLEMAGGPVLFVH